MAFDSGKWVNSYMSDAFSWDFIPKEIEAEADEPVENTNPAMHKEDSDRPLALSWSSIPTRAKASHNPSSSSHGIGKEYSPIYRLADNNRSQYLGLVPDSMNEFMSICENYKIVDDGDTVQEVASNLNSQAGSDNESVYETDLSELSASIANPVEWRSDRPDWICPLFIHCRAELLMNVEDHSYPRALMYPHKQERLKGRGAYRRQRRKSHYEIPAPIHICYGQRSYYRDRFPLSIYLPQLYSPLSTQSKQVRLLEILPGRQGLHGLECELTVVSLEDKPVYEALSYTWGEPTSLLPIRVNGHRVLVRTNLAGALQDLRQTFGCRTLWIDALCINQDDINERNHQVGQMGDIYKQATQVLVWLTSGHGTSSFTTKHNRLYSLYPEYNVEDTVNCIKKLAPLTVFGSEEIETYLVGGGLLAMAFLCARPYWNRLWIVQEVLLATRLKIHISIEGYSIDWDEWTKVRKLLENIPAEVQPSPWAMDAIELICSSLPTQFDKQREHRLQGWPLHKLLTMCESSLCQDPRDKIYGLLGLANDFDVGDLTIDYSRSLFQVYTDAIGFHNSSHNKRHGNYLHTMAFSQLVQRVLDGPFEASINPSNIGASIDSFDAKPTPPQVFRIGSSKRGYILPLDILLSDKSIESLQQRDTLCVLADYIPHISRGRLSEMLQRLDSLERHQLVPISSTTSYASDREEQYSPPKELLEPPTETSKETGTTFFVTSLGDFGLASTCIREGDILCRFADCDTAAIVRKQGSIYRLVCRAAVASDHSLDGDVSGSEGSIENMYCWLSIDVIQDLTCKATSTNKHEFREDIFTQETYLEWNE